MTRKVILDTDPGIDDAVAIAWALGEPRLEVLALTAVAGNVGADQATRNVHAILAQLDPPRWPRIGAAAPPDHPNETHAEHIHGADGLGNAEFPVAELHNVHSSDKVLTDIIRAHPHDVTVIALGPLTNLARALARDPELASLIGQVVIMGGAVNGIGNVTPSAEFNIYCDPPAARAVFRSHLTKTLIPLDVTNQLVMTFDFLDQLDERTHSGKFLRRVLPFAYRSHRQELGMEGIHIHDAVAVVAATYPELFTTEGLHGDVETAGALTRGMTVFDRRTHNRQRRNMDVALEMDVAAVRDVILRGLRW